MANQIVMCPKCNVPMTWREAGVSKKTGKPYKGFWGCPNWKEGCKETYKPEQPTGKTEEFGRSLDQNLQEEKIKSAVKEKRDNIAWLNAKNNAVSLVANHDLYRPIKDEATLKKTIKLLTAWLYSFQPLTEQQITEVKEVSSELEKIGDEIPF